MPYTPTIGLEIHTELKTKTKMFCSCKNDPFEKRPNFNICPICTGQPGTLPVANANAIKMVLKTGLALNCKIPEISQFDRKNYFYPDLPKGYQISQLYNPFCLNGYLEVEGKKIKIREVHLEEDTGRLAHPEGADFSLVDFNRAGVPLMELATDPDMNSAKEAKKFAEEFHLIMHYLGVSDADMEKGEMRVEVNISVSKEEGVLGTKVEIKNLNSFRAVERSIEYEIERQTKLLEKKEKVIQETRGWDDVKGKTFSQREKESAHDYRYFPEPDLPPLNHSQKFINEIRAEIPELPQQKRQRFQKEYGLSQENSEVFVYNKDLGEYFERVISEFEPNLPKEKLSKLVKLASNYIITDLQGLLKGKSPKDKTFLITAENFAEFIRLIEDAKISSKTAKAVLIEMHNKGIDPSNFIAEQGLGQVSDSVEIEKIIQEVILKNQKAVKDYKAGKENAFQYLVGQIMAQSRGRSNPQVVRETLKVILDKIV